AADLFANALLLVGPLVMLVVRPAPVHPLVSEAGDRWSWLALLLCLAVSAWYFRRIAGRFGVYVLCGLGMTFGVLTAATLAPFDHDNWLCYHVLTASWALTGVVTVAVAWRRERAGDSGTSLPGTTPLLFPFVVVRRVVLILAVLVAALGLRGL